MLRLYMDVHVNAAITAGVRRRGIQVLTAQEDGSQRFEDTLLLDRATALQRVLFSQDEVLLNNFWLGVPNRAARPQASTVSPDNATPSR